MSAAPDAIKPMGNEIRLIAGQARTEDRAAFSHACASALSFGLRRSLRIRVLLAIAVVIVAVCTLSLSSGISHAYALNPSSSEYGAHLEASADCPTGQKPGSVAGAGVGDAPCDSDGTGDDCGQGLNHESQNEAGASEGAGNESEQGNNQFCQGDGAQSGEPPKESPVVQNGLVALLSSDNQLLIRLRQQGDDVLFASFAADGSTASDKANGSNAAGNFENSGKSGNSNNSENPDEAGCFNISAFPSALGQAQTIAVFDLGDGDVGENQRTPWYESRGMIRSVVFGAGVQPSTMANWFADLDKLERIDFQNLDTSCVRSMRQLFSDCSSLNDLDMRRFNTSVVQDMSRMFAGCASVAALDLSSFDTTSVKSMSGMFSGCESLKSLDLSSFNTREVTDMTDMFSGCKNVEMLNLKSFNTEKLESSDGMFSGCTSLAALDVAGFTPTQLEVAAIPADNPGGFWRLNVPKGYDSGITLREPTSAEKAAYGIGEGGSSAGGNPESQQQGGEGDSGEKASPTSGKTADDERSADDNANSGQVGAIATGFPYFADMLEAIADTTSDPSSSVSAALVANALSEFVRELTGPVASVADSVSTDMGDMVDAANSVLGALGIGARLDKTMAMVTAAIGMIMAAGLILVICLKIR